MRVTLKTITPKNFNPEHHADTIMKCRVKECRLEVRDLTKRNLPLKHAVYACLTKKGTEAALLMSPPLALSAELSDANQENLPDQQNTQNLDMRSCQPVI